LGWLPFFVRHITALPQPKKIQKIFIQIQVFAELWVSWAGLNLLLIFPMWGDTEKRKIEAERKPLWEIAITLAPHAHSQFPQNFVALHGMGVGRYMEWACGAAGLLVSNQLEGLPHVRPFL
jgi:hypothetical protein